MNSYDVLIGVPPIAGEIPADGFRSEDRAFQQRIHELLLELLDAAPFDRLRASVQWLEPAGRSRWAEVIFNFVSGALAEHGSDSFSESAGR